MASEALSKEKIRITLSGKYSDGKSIKILFPVNPEKINTKASGRFQEYNIINLGTARVPNGKEMQYVSWECFFPSSQYRKDPYVIPRSDQPKNKKYQASAYHRPETYRKYIEYWRKNGKKLSLQITGTPIKMSCYIENYEEVYEGPNRNVSYAIELSEAIDVKIETVKKKKGKTGGSKRSSKNSGKKKYRVKKGDCLWNIAKKFYCSGTQWKKIYKANKDQIEAFAVKHGKKCSNKGKWIYPGEKFKIP